MTEEEMLQPILTKKDLIDALSSLPTKKELEQSLSGFLKKDDLEGALVEFNDKTLKPQMEEIMRDGLANFNINFLEPAKAELKEEIIKSEQRSRDWTDKKVGEAKGEIVKATKEIKEIKEIFQTHKDKDEEFKNKVIDVFDKNNLISKEEKEGLAVLVA